MSPNKTRRALTKLQRARQPRNAWVRMMVDDFKKFAKLQRKRVRHRLATEPQCPSFTTHMGMRITCQLPNGHEGVCLDLDDRAMYAGEVLTPEMRYEIADALDDMLEGYIRPLSGGRIFGL